MSFPLILEKLNEKAKNTEVVHLASTEKEVVTTQLQFTSAPQIGSGEDPEPAPTKSEVVLLTGDQTISGNKTFTGTVHIDNLEATISSVEYASSAGIATSASNATNASSATIAISAITQDMTDSSTKIATTEFVKLAVSEKSKVSVSSSGTSLNQVSYITVNDTEYKLAGGTSSGYLPLSGGTIDGDLIISGDLTVTNSISGIITSAINATYATSAGSITGIVDSATSATYATSATSATYATSASSVTGIVSSATNATSATYAERVTGVVSSATSATYALSAEEAISATSATTATKLGSIIVGGTNQAIYISSGTPVAVSVVTSATSATYATNAGSVTGVVSSATSATSATYATSAVNYLPLVGGTLTGNFKTKSEFGTVGTILNGYQIDLSTGTIFSVSITSSRTFYFENCLSSSTNCFQLIIVNGGNYTCTFPSSVKWVNGEVPELTSGGTDILSFMTNNGGTTWYGILTASNVATA